MSKTNSGHFSGTNGDKISRYTSASKTEHTKPSESDIIASRVSGLDLNAHPLKYKQLSAKTMTALRKKVQERSITRSEYKIYESNRRLSRRRDKGVDDFWKQEAKRLLSGERSTRDWTPEQKHDIIHNRRPKQNGKTIQSHHTYSVSQYPHLANKGEIIYPATFREHLYIWHGGNFKNSLPGKPIKKNLSYRTGGKK